MDLLSFLGIAIALAAIVGGQYLEGGSLLTLVNAPACLIVLGGTIGATMLQTPGRVFRRAMQISFWVIWPPSFDTKEGVAKILEWSSIARREGLLGLENVVDFEDDEFSKKGLQLLVDGNDPKVIRQILETDLNNKEQHSLQAARVYEGMGGYAPTMGIIGAVMGLIMVMGNLTDPAVLGEGIAVAFVATIYGVGSANILFLPMADKLKLIIYKEIQFHEMFIEGVVSISEGENPSNIEMRLHGFLQNN